MCHNLRRTGEFDEVSPELRDEPESAGAFELAVQAQPSMPMATKPPSRQEKRSWTGFDLRYHSETRHLSYPTRIILILDGMSGINYLVWVWLVASLCCDVIFALGMGYSDQIVIERRSTRGDCISRKIAAQKLHCASGGIDIAEP